MTRLACMLSLAWVALAGTPEPAAAADAPVATVAAQRSCSARLRELFGADVATLHDVRPEDRVAAARLGLDDRLQVVAVDVGSAAARAGLRVGDVIVAIDGEAIAGGVDARPALLAAAGDEHPRELHLLRDANPLRVRIAGTGACVRRI